MKIENIFISGVERSGTTLLASLLVSSQVGVSGPETIFKKHLFSNINYSDACRRIASDFRFRRIWGPSFKFLDSKPWYVNFRTMFRDINHIFGDDFVLIDHSPHNLLYVDEIMDGLPNSGFIHIVRDPRGVFNSIKDLDWGPSTPIRCSFYWLRKINRYEASLRATNAPCLVVRYEDLVENPEIEVPRILEFFDLEADNRYGKSLRLPNYTKAQHHLVNSPLSKERTLAFERLKKRDLKLINFVCGHQMLKYGYLDSLPRENLLDAPFSFSFLLSFFDTFVIEMYRYPYQKLCNILRRFV